MSAIASAFSQFATMTTGQSERTNVVVTAKRALELYKEAYISLDVADENLYAQLDSTQLVRVVNNLLSNALQATNDIANPKIDVRIDADTNWLTFEVCDNGKGYF